MKGGKDIWDNFWSKYKFGVKDDRQIIRQEISSLRWRKIERRIIDKYGSFGGLRVIEVGSGRGEVSALMALKGAKVNLLDYSDIALKRAKALFKNLGLKADFIIADVLNIPKELLGNFDISMSFGLAEHFTYPQRQTIFEVHQDLLNDRGIFFIAIPNRYCLPYRIFMKAAQLLGYWKVGLEIPFSRTELKKIASQIGLRKYEIVGSSLIRDTLYFLLARSIFRLSKGKVKIDTSSFEIPSIFDDYFGYSLVLIGAKAGKSS